MLPHPIHLSPELPLHFVVESANLKKCPKSSPKVIGFLEHMKDNYRNPIAHPDQTLSADDAQILFGVCVGAISMMIAEIKSLTASGELLPLTQVDPITLP
jgi:hypothetical protein